MMREKRVKRQPIQAAVLTKEDKKAFNRELLTLAVPLALQNLLVALVGASDALMLGRLNQASIAAVSLANQVSFLCNRNLSNLVCTCRNFHVDRLYLQSFANDLHHLFSLRACNVVSDFHPEILLCF